MPNESMCQFIADGNHCTKKSIFASLGGCPHETLTCILPAKHTFNFKASTSFKYDKSRDPYGCLIADGEVYCNSLQKCIQPWITRCSEIPKCQIHDSDVCLRKSSAWDSSTHDWQSSWTCATARNYCNSWAKDLMRCCPLTCGLSKPISEEECNALQASGTCNYPNEAEPTCDPNRRELDCGSVTSQPECYGYQIPNEQYSKSTYICAWHPTNKCVSIDTGEELGASAKEHIQTTSPNMKWEDYCPTLEPAECFDPCVLMGSPPRCQELDRLAIYKPHVLQKKEESQAKFDVKFMIFGVLIVVIVILLQKQRKNRMQTIDTTTLVNDSMEP